MFNKSYQVLILLALLLTACSQQYSAERDFYRASKYSADIFKDPKGIPPYKFEKALANFQAIMTKYPRTQQAIESYFIAGDIYMLENRYRDAAALFQTVKKAYPDQVGLQARATIAIAGCLEKENDWPGAYRNYREAVEKYPGEPATLQVPVYILDYYRQSGEKSKEEQVYRQAVRDYKNVINKYSETKSAYSARNLLTEVYMRGGDWANVLATLSEQVKKYPQSPDAPTWLMTMAATYEMKLNNKAKAREYYQMVKDKYSTSPWAKEADKRLASLTAAK